LAALSGALVLVAGSFCARRWSKPLISTPFAGVPVLRSMTSGRMFLVEQA
jgi:hypothetical protein